MRSTDQPAEKPQGPEAATPATIEELFDWSGYEAWLAEPSQDAFLWMLEEDE